MHGYTKAASPSGTCACCCGLSFSSDPPVIRWEENWQDTPSHFLSMLGPMMHYQYCRSDEHDVVDVVCVCCPAQEMLAHKKAVQRMGKKSKVSWAGWLVGAGLGGSAAACMWSNFTLHTVKLCRVRKWGWIGQIGSRICINLHLDLCCVIWCGETTVKR
jgi:hypothetical protein